MPTQSRPSALRPLALLSEAMCHRKYGTPATTGASKKQKVQPLEPGQTTLTFGVGIVRTDTPAVVLPPPSCGSNREVPMEVETPREASPTQKGVPTSAVKGPITEVRVKLNLRFPPVLSGVVTSLATHIEICQVKGLKAKRRSFAFSPHLTMLQPAFFF